MIKNRWEDTRSCDLLRFRFTRHQRDRSRLFGVDTRTIRRWAKDEEWEIALGNVNYTGERSFETQPYRDTERDAGDTFEKARTLYIEARNTGVPKHKRARLAAEATGLTPRRIRNWANRYGWATEMKPNA